VTRGTLPLSRRALVILVFVLVSLILVLAFALRDGFLTADRVWARVQRTGEWRVGLDPSFPPFEVVDHEGQIVGFDVDLARAIAARWGVRVTLVSIGFDGLTDAVRAGKVDAVISAMPYDATLTRDVRFSDPYFEAGWRVVVPVDSPVRHLDDLSGSRLAAEWGSKGDLWARRLQARYAAVELVLKPTPEEVVQAVLGDEADAAILDGVTAREQANQLRSVGEPLSSEPYVVVMPRRAPRLQAEVNKSLRALREDGTLDALEARWFTK